MDKLCVFFVIALFTNAALGQADQPENGQNPLPRPTTTARPGTVTSATPTTQSPELRQCLTQCPVTPEYNPVCGTNSVTYGNPGRLICAQMCGVNVNLSRMSPCPTPPPTIDGVPQI